MAQFILKITLGNEAMQTGEDIYWVLKRVCEAVQGEDNLKGRNEKIFDINGNTVGSWQVK